MSNPGEQLAEIGKLARAHRRAQEEQRGFIQQARRCYLASNNGQPRTTEEYAQRDEWMRLAKERDRAHAEGLALLAQLLAICEALP